MSIIKLQSNDGVVFEVDVEIAKCSLTLKTMLENLGVDKDGEEDPIPLPIIRSVILNKIIQWATHHKNDPPYFKTYENGFPRTDDMCPWDIEFFKMDQGMLLDLMQAANYLDIKPIMETACKTIAHKMKGKSSEELRNIFGVKNDFTPEEERQLRMYKK